MNTPSTYAAFHACVDMGVCFRFSLSAKAVDYIRSIGGIEPYELLQVGVNPSSYFARLVRIDFTADFIDECFTVQEIYDGLNDGSLHVMREHLMFALGRLRSGKRRS